MISGKDIEESESQSQTSDNTLTAATLPAFNQYILPDVEVMRLVFCWAPEYEGSFEPLLDAEIPFIFLEPWDWDFGLVTGFEELVKD